MSQYPATVNLRTPDLQRAWADYTQVLGFDGQQHVPGVFARLTHGSLCVQLWAFGARPGRWEQPTPGETAFAPGHHRVEVVGLHALHASLRSVLLRPCRTRLAGRTLLHAQRLGSDTPQWMDWRAWESTLLDADGHVLHLIDRAPWRPGAPARHPPGAEVAK